MNNCEFLIKRPLNRESSDAQSLKKAKHNLVFDRLEEKDLIAEIQAKAFSFLGQKRYELEMGQDFKIIVKSDLDVDIEELESQVYHSAVICGKQHLVAPIKSISLPGIDNKIALQLYLTSGEYVQLSDYLNENEPKAVCSFEKIAEAVLFEFIFGMRVCTEENLTLNRLNGDIIHFDNQYSWRDSNSCEDDGEIPFTSALLSFDETHRPLNLKQLEFLEKEVENYESKLNELSEFLIIKNKDLNTISSLKERIDLLKKGLCNSKKFHYSTLADVILSANMDCKKIIYLKLALLIFKRVNEELDEFKNLDRFSKSTTLSFLQEIKKAVFSSLCTFSDCWEDLITEIEDETLNDAVINKMQNLSELSIHDFVFQFSFSLMPEDVSVPIDLASEETLGIIPII